MGVITSPRVPEGPEGNPIVAVDYELFGQVQGKSGATCSGSVLLKLCFVLGCFFTKYAKEVAEHLGVGGWIKNTKKGTIMGKIQAPKSALQEM